MSTKEMLFRSARVVNGQLDGVTIAVRSFLRDRVPVTNALPEGYVGGSGEGFPDFSSDQKKSFVSQGLMPLSEIRYWLGWANCLREDPDEYPFVLENWLKPDVDLESLTDDQRDKVTAHALLQYTMRTLPSDYPTGKALLAYLNVTLNVYTNLCPDDKETTFKSDLVEDQLMVRISDYVEFLNHFGPVGSDPDRVSLVKALDEFVGRYIKN